MELLGPFLASWDWCVCFFGTCLQTWMKQRGRSATCQARSKFRWKWKKKRTRRLQKKRRKMRQRSKWRGTTNFTAFQVSQKLWWASWTKFPPCSQIFSEAERRQMTKQEVRGVTMRQWNDRQNGWVGAFEGHVSSLDWTGTALGLKKWCDFVRALGLCRVLTWSQLIEDFRHTWLHLSYRKLVILLQPLIDDLLGEHLGTPIQLQSSPVHGQPS